MFVIVCLLCAEWLHSSVHGCPGESPRGGPVPSGEQRQSEYGHWGTVHISVFVLCRVFVCRSCVRTSHLYSLSPCYYICCTNHLHLLPSSASFLLSSSRPHSLRIPVCFPSLLFSVSHSPFVCPISFLRPPPPPACPVPPRPLLPRRPHLFMRDKAELHWLVVYGGGGRVTLSGSLMRSALLAASPSTAAASVTALIYVTQPVEAIRTHTYQSPHVDRHISTCTYGDK